MHVKLEPRHDLDLPVLDFIEDMETDFREELFGNRPVPSDLSESSYSDDDILRFATDCQFSDDLPLHHSPHTWRSNSTSSRSSSSSGSFEHNTYDMEYRVGSYPSPLQEDELEVGFDDGVSPLEVMLSTEDLKNEPQSPIHYINVNTDLHGTDDLWNFLNSDEVKPNLSIPETPPVTPPNDCSYLEESPPTSPISISSIDESCSQIPTTAVITLTQISPSTSDHIKKVPLAPKLPFKVVTTISASGAQSKVTCSRAIKIQPKLSPVTIQKPIIRLIDNSPNKINVSTVRVGSNNNVSTNLLETQMISNTLVTSSPAQQSSNIIQSAISVPVSSQSSVCSVVSEKRVSNLPAIAPALNSGQKNTSLAEFRALKRQERMIKNRESASLSRKRKKEYLQGLEEEVRDLRIENARLTMENENLQRRLSTFENERGLFKKLPLKRTSTTALLGVTFLFLFNASSFLNAFSSNNFKQFGLDVRGKDSTGPLLNMGTDQSEVKFMQRSLLWIPSIEDAVNKKSPVAPGNTSTVCPLHINATESLRIENELRDWFESRIDSSKVDWNPQKAFPTKKYPQSPLLKTFHPKTTAGRDNSLVKRTKEVPVKEAEKAVAATLVLPSTIPTYHYVYPSVDEKKTLPASLIPEENGASQGLISLVGNIHTLLESIERRNDTYYVVSLSSDHLLLPASSHNTSVRPKMSLLVPTPRSINDPSLQISLMQIDCEVTHTQLIRVGQSSVSLNNSSFHDNGNETAQDSQSPPTHGPLPREKFTMKRKRKNRLALN